MTAANAPSPADLTDELASALDWWRAAGVDDDFEDEAISWLADRAAQAPPEAAAETQTANTSGEQNAAFAHQSPMRPPATSQSGPASETAPEPAPAIPRTDFFADGRPANLAEFREFWLSAPGLDVIGPRGRIPPRGNPEAETMVLVIDPEKADRDTLLSDTQGRFLQRILAATGIDPDNVYFASALPRHTPMADTHALAQGGMDAVLACHIALLAPKRLLGFGAGLAPLLGMGVKNPDTDLREFNMSAPEQSILMSEGLDSLMGMPRLKARFWRRWIEWSAQHR